MRKNTFQARPDSLAKAGTKGKKRSASLKNIATPISNKQKKSWGSSIDATNLAAATHDNDTDSIVDQDVDAILAGIPNYSFQSQQELQGDILDNDESNKYNDNDNDNEDNHFGMKYNATVYDGGKSTFAAVNQARLSANPSSANVAASIAPDLSTLSRNGLIDAASEALRVQRSLEHEVAALQETMLSMQNQWQISSTAISGYQEGALWANHWLKKKYLCIISPIMVHYVVKDVFRTQKLFFLLKMWVISCYLFCNCHYSYLLKFF